MLTVDSGEPLLRLRIARRLLVGTLWRAFRDFATSAAYDPECYEQMDLGRVLEHRSGRGRERIADDALAMTRRQWRAFLAQHVGRRPPSSLFWGVDTWAKRRRWIDRRVSRHWDRKTVEARRAEVETLLGEGMDGPEGGAPLAALGSEVIEAYLAGGVVGLEGVEAMVAA